MRILSRNLRWLAVLCGVLLASCSTSTQPLQLAAKPKLIISTAASTKDMMQTLADEFAAIEKITIELNAGPSSGLATQIIAGAPADLFLSANRSWPTKIEETKLATASHALLTNSLVLIVPRGNPGEVKSPEDLLSDKVAKLALAGEQVPAGMYADQALTKLQLLEKLTAANKIARAQDVRGALSFVERGEAEAGIVYSTDAAITKNVEVVHTFDPALHEEIVYVLVLLKHGDQHPAAKAFYDYLQSSKAEESFIAAGFQRSKPSETSP